MGMACFDYIQSYNNLYLNNRYVSNLKKKKFLDSIEEITKHIIPGDQEGLFKLAVQLRKFFNSVIYNTATGYVLLVYLTNI
jgi:hypothetical protein